MKLTTEEIDIEFYKLNKSSSVASEMSDWLDAHMPNPPLPEPQRWAVGYSRNNKVGFKFADKKDFMLFMLKWS
jgi:hypothetical protein